MLSQAPGNDNIMIQGAEVRFRNFAGAEKTFNSEGDRNFCIFLNPEDAEYMRQRGWNVKQLRPKEEGDVPQEYVQVAVSYGKGRPPRVVVVNSKGRLDIGADDVHMLDWADVKNWDVVLNPYAWEIKQGSAPPKTGIKAYLKTCFATINEDELELLYAEVPDAQDPTKGLSSTANEDDD